MPDTSGEEVDRQDETWCLWDGQLIDDELYLELSRFAAGVRVLVLSDSCHSGTVTRAAPASPPVVLPGQPRPRLIAGRFRMEKGRIWHTALSGVARLATAQMSNCRELITARGRGDYSPKGYCIAVALSTYKVCKSLPI